MEKTSRFVPRTVLLVIAGALSFTLAAHGATPALAVGQANATFKVKGKIYKLTHAAAFVDQKDKAKPVILLITDVQLPAASWTSEFDFMGYRSAGHKVTGVAFWLDDKRQFARSDYYIESASTSGNLFELHFDSPPGKSFVGAVYATKAASQEMFGSITLEGAFNAALK